MDLSLARAFADCPVFGPLPAADRARLVTYSATRVFAQGEALYRRDRPAATFFLVRTGTVGLTDGADTGIVDAGAPGTQAGGLADDTFADIVGPGELVGDEAVFERGRHTASAIALLPVTAVAIDADAFIAHADDRVDMVVAMMAGASSRLRRLILEITELKLQSTTRRLAGYLLRQAGAERGSACVQLPCEKRQLAERLGMKPESLSRALAKLRAHGVRSGRPDTVEIADLESLRAFWQSDDERWEA